MKEGDTSPCYTLNGCNWELTLACTLRCMHCGSRAGRPRQNELSLGECLGVADQLSDLGCRECTMIGGEVFLYRGWQELAAYLADKGIRVNIVSNGYILGRAEIEQIRQAGLVNVGLSIDGMAPSHNRIRGKSDAFERIEKSLDLLNGEGIEVGAVTSLMQFNCADLPELYEFLLDHRVQVWQLQLVSPMGNMAGGRDFITRPEQVRPIVEFIRDANKDRRMVVIAADSIGYFDDNEAYIRGGSSPINCWGGCSAGITGLFIDSVGNVKGCGALYADGFIEGNVRQRPLADIWNDEHAFIYNRRFSTDLLTGVCAGCDVGHVCRGGCRSSNFFAKWTLYESAFCCRSR